MLKTFVIPAPLISCMIMIVTTTVLILGTIHMIELLHMFIEASRELIE